MNKTETKEIMCLTGKLKEEIILNKKRILNLTEILEITLTLSQEQLPRDKF